MCCVLVACSDATPATESDLDNQLLDTSQNQDSTIDEDSSPQGALAWNVDQLGPYHVGYRTMTFTYDAVGHDDPRPIKLSVWYPTEESSGEAASYLGLLDDELAFRDASLAPSVYGDHYPVHIHSHGHQGFAGSSNFLMRHFASHGWVVAAPDHTGNTLVDNIEPRPPWMYAVRPADISASLNHLENLPVEDPLQGKLRTDRVVMSGHSFGGYTSFVSAGASFDEPKIQALCTDDPCSDDTLTAFAEGVRDGRVVAAVPMAAGNRDMFGENGYGELDCPVMYMTGSIDHPNLNEAVWAGLEGTDSIRVDIEGGCHQLFGLGACHEISDEEGFAIVQGYVLAFARRYILDDSGVAGLLNGESTLSDRVLYFTHQTK